MNIKTKIRKLIQKEKSPWNSFFLKTHNKRGSTPYPHKIPPQWSKIYYKAYERFPVVPLPKPSRSLGKLSDALINRETTRQYSSKPITLSQLSTLLYHSCGEKKNNRFYPSAGARYPLEIYIVANNIQSLPIGIYHYYIKEHSLEQLARTDRLDCSSLYINSSHAQAPCLLFITAVFERNIIKYRDRGYNYVLIETGHLGQNLYLLASTLGLGIAAIGGYFEEPVHKLLDVDRDESCIYSFTLGNFHESN